MAAAKTTGNAPTTAAAMKKPAAAGKATGKKEKVVEVEEEVVEVEEEEEVTSLTLRNKNKMQWVSAQLKKGGLKEFAEVFTSAEKDSKFKGTQLVNECVVRDKHGRWTIDCAKPIFQDWGLLFYGGVKHIKNYHFKVLVYIIVRLCVCMYVY